MVDTLKSKFSSEASANTTEVITDTVGSSEVDTILSIYIINIHPNNDTTFKLRLNPASGNTTDIYLNQPLPAMGTFIHNSKIVLIEGDVLEFQTSAAVNCNIAVSYLHQTAVSTSSDYLDRFIFRSNAASPSPIIVDNSADSKTILSFTLCNRHATDSMTFGVGVRRSTGLAFDIYKVQTLPAGATFEHSDKIMLQNNEELIMAGSSSVEVDVVTSYLRQP